MKLNRLYSTNPFMKGKFSTTQFGPVGDLRPTVQKKPFRPAVPYQDRLVMGRKMNYPQGA